jgi:hypothetical protein
MNAIAEALSPDLVAAGFALLVPTAKRWMLRRQNSVGLRKSLMV